jgi:endogenous inhibitor of DNA gyrase (YacG/DUF329 family)
MSQPARTRKCAACGKPQVKEHRPFCSKRCAQLDLGRWLGERYAIPAVEDPDGPDEGSGEDG